MTCEECGGTGVFLPQPHDTLGMPNGWVQKCDSCGKYEDDLEAMNAHRASRGLPPMRGYPFSLVDREDASPENVLEQEFVVTTDDYSLWNITLSNSGDGPFDELELEMMIAERFVATHGQPASKLEVVDCGPVKQLKGV